MEESITFGLLYLDTLSAERCRHCPLENNFTNDVNKSHNQGRTKRMQATARSSSVLPSMFSARRRLIGDVRATSVSTQPRNDSLLHET
jgi:hypothetical protein